VSARISSRLQAQGGPSSALVKNSTPALGIRKSVAGALCFSFAVLVFPCQTSLFQPGQGMHCRAARIELSPSDSTRATHRGKMVGYSVQKVTGFTNSEPSQSGARWPYAEIGIELPSNSVHQKWNPRPPPASIRF
jgi:hypothetical protein